MRVDEQEITGPSDVPSFSKSQQTYYTRRSLQQLLEEVETKQGSNYNRVPVFNRAPYVRLPMDDPTLYNLFSVFFTPHLLDRLAYFTNKKAHKWWRDPTQEKWEHTRKWEETDASEVGAWLRIRLLIGLDHSTKYTSYWNTNINGPIYVSI